jgi:hypothetical protein
VEIIQVEMAVQAGAAVELERNVHRARHAQGQLTK